MELGLQDDGRHEQFSPHGINNQQQDVLLACSHPTFRIEKWKTITVHGKRFCENIWKMLLVIVLRVSY
jgi:hypothetical protein